MKNKYKLNNANLFIISICTVFVIMLVFNFLTPLIADDLQYLYKTQGFSTILKNEYTQYMMWTGRSIVHIIARVFLLLPKFVFNVFNSVAYVYLTVLILQISKWDYKKSFLSSKYILINIVIWLFIPSFGQVFLWETGSANYLWGSIIMLSMILIYHRAYREQSNSFLEKNKILSFFIMLLLGIVSGWCNENTSGGALLIIIMYTLVMKKSKNYFQSWMLSGIVGMAIGLIMMISAPGNIIRATYFERDSWSFLKKIIFGFLQITYSLKENALCFFILLGIVIILGYIVYNDKDRLLLALGYVSAGIATIYVLSVSPSGLNWGRSFYGGILYLIIAFFISYPDVLKFEVRYIYIILSISMIIPFVFSFILGTLEIGKSYISINKSYDYLEQQKKLGNLDPLFPEIDNPNTSYTAYSDALSHVGSDKNSKINRSTAKYFGLRSVKGITKSDWNNIYLNGEPNLMKVGNLGDYLEEVFEKNYTIALVSNNYMNSINSKDLERIKKIFPNFQTSNDTQMTFCGVSNSKNQQEVIQKDFSSFITTLKDKKLELKSSFTVYEDQRFTSIKLDGVELSRNKDGLNFVVFEEESGRILDSVNFNQSGSINRAFR